MPVRRQKPARGGRSRGHLVAETLRVADAFRGASRTVEEVAQTTEVHPRTVYRILRALQEAGYAFSVTEVARVSGSGRPGRRYQLTSHGNVPGLPQADTALERRKR